MLAAGEHARALIDPFGDAREKRQHSVEVLGNRLAVGSSVSAHQQIFAHAHHREDSARFGNRAYSGADHAMGGLAINPRAVENDRSRARRKQTEDDLHGRRFAARIAAQQRDDPTFFDLERKVEMDLNRAVERIDAVKAQERAHDATASAERDAAPTPLWPR
jgi:hypothetical protein